MLAVPFALPAQTGPLVLAEDGRTEYSIVVPNAPADEGIAESLDLAARVIQAAFEASGTKITVTNEAAHTSEQAGIYLGDTAFGRANDIDPSKLEGWDYVHRDWVRK